MKKRVLILGKLPPPYMGPSIGTEIMLKSSLNESFELFHLDTKANYSLKTLGKWSFYKLFKNFAIYASLGRMILKNRPDLIMVPLSQKTLGYLKDSFFLIIARLFGVKTVIHFLGGNFKEWVKECPWIVKFYVKSTLRFSEGVIVLGHKLQYHFEDYFKKEKIFVVPNGSNYQIPLKTSRVTDEIKLIYLSNLLPTKGIEDILNALVILKQTNTKPYSLHIVGSWRDLQTQTLCLRIIEKNQLPVTFSPPEISNKEKFVCLVNSDIFVFTPRVPEGQPWAILEALAVGLPIISTDCGAITESVECGVNGFIVDKRNPQQIAEKVKYLIDNADIRKIMGSQSRTKYEENFTEEKMVENLRACFNQLIDPKV